MKIASPLTIDNDLRLKELRSKEKYSQLSPPRSFAPTLPRGCARYNRRARKREQNKRRGFLPAPQDNPFVAQAMTLPDGKSVALPYHLNDEKVMVDLLVQMRKSPNNREYQFHGLYAMRDLLSGGHQDLCYRVLNKAELPIHGIDVAMKKYSEDPRIQREGCSVFSLLAKDYVQRQSIQDDNLEHPFRSMMVQAVVRAMKFYPCDPAVQTPGCSAICEWSSCDCFHEALVRIGAVDVTVSAMERYETNEQIQESGCKTLREMCQKVMHTAGVDCVLAAVQRHVNHEEIITVGTDFLALWSRQEIVRERIAFGGGIDILIGASLAFETNANIQTAVWMVLGLLALCCDESPNIRFQKSVLDVALRMSARHQSNAHVQSGIFLFLAHYMHNKLSKSISMDISRDSVEQLIRVMGFHVMNDEIQDSACHLLGVFSSCDKTIAGVVEAGGMEAVMKAVNAHPEAHLVQHFGVRTITVMVSRDTKRCLRIAVKAGFAVSAVAAMHRHPGDKILQYNGIILLARFVNAGFQTDIIQNGGIRAIVSGVTTPESVPAVIALDYYASVLFVLRGLLRSAPGKILESCVDAGGIAAVISAMQTTVDNERAHVAGFFLLQILLAHCSYTSAELLNSNGIPVMLDSMKRRAENRRIQIHGSSVLVLLMNPALSPIYMEARGCIKGVGGQNVLICAALKFPGDKEIESAVGTALQFLFYPPSAIHDID